MTSPGTDQTEPPQAFASASVPAPKRFSRLTLLLFALLLLLGTTFRLYKFPEVPIGLHQDEASEAYEAYSLLKTGKDRWGYRWPVYFVGWGSGQNVLQSYLTIPVVAVLGLTKTSARAIPLLAGLLGLPLLFFTVRRWHGQTAALAALLFLACCPWHVMISRLGIENVELPFFLLLGVFCFHLALESASLWPVLASFLAFAASLYCYGSVVVVLPLLLPLLAWLGYRTIARRPLRWAIGLALFVLCALPTAFFVLKNYITKTDYSFERWLPFTAPLLPMTRLSQTRAELNGDTLLHRNLTFIEHGFSARMAWFSIYGIHPLPTVVLVLAAVGIVMQIRRLLRTRRPREPFLLWILACLPLFFLFPINVSRAIAFYMPVVALAGAGFAFLFDAAGTSARKLAVTLVCFGFLLMPTIRFAHAYFGGEYRNEVRGTLYPELPAALTAVQQIAGPTTPIYVTDSILLNYMDVLFYLQIDPASFQRSGAAWNHPDFGRFLFSPASARNSSRPLAFLLKPDETQPCLATVPVQAIGQLVVGKCP